jgi:hypothetical protein
VVGGGLYFINSLQKKHRQPPSCIVKFLKILPSVVSGYGKRSINLNKVVATFEEHIFLSQTDLTRIGIISNSYNEMFEA